MKEEQNSPISVSSIQASESLQSINEIQENFGKAVLASLAGPILMIWGLMTFCGYMGAHFYPAHELWIWLAVAVVGYSGTAYFTIRYCRQKVRARNERSKQHIKTIYLVWISVSVYGILCMFILAPSKNFLSSAQIKTHTAIIPMLCWFLMGVLDDDRRSMLYSLTIIGLIVFGFYVFAGDINVWLAFSVAVPLFLVGLQPYLKRRRTCQN